MNQLVEDQALPTFYQRSNGNESPDQHMLSTNGSYRVLNGTLDR